MKNRTCPALLLLLSALIAARCSQPAVAVSHRAEAIKEIARAEAGFADLCAVQGIAKAFAAYSDDSAHIRSDDSLISGKRSIIKYYSQPFFKNVSLQWKPDFADAGESGDIGYTYGHYTFAKTNSKGEKTTSKGIFHTVWKKKNGVWKFVWDS